MLDATQITLVQSTWSKVHPISKTATDVKTAWTETNMLLAGVVQDTAKKLEKAAYPATAIFHANPVG